MASLPDGVSVSETVQIICSNRISI